MEHRWRESSRWEEVLKPAPLCLSRFWPGRREFSVHPAPCANPVLEVVTPEMEFPAEAPEVSRALSLRASDEPRSTPSWSSRAPQQAAIPWKSGGLRARGHEDPEEWWCRPDRQSLLRPLRRRESRLT